MMLMYDPGLQSLDRFETLFGALKLNSGRLEWWNHRYLGCWPLILERQRIGQSLMNVGEGHEARRQMGVHANGRFTRFFVIVRDEDKFGAPRQEFDPTYEIAPPANALFGGPSQIRVFSPEGYDLLYGEADLFKKPHFVLKLGVARPLVVPAQEMPMVSVDFQETDAVRKEHAASAYSFRMETLQLTLPEPAKRRKSGEAPRLISAANTLQRLMDFMSSAEEGKDTLRLSIVESGAVIYETEFPSFRDAAYLFNQGWYHYRLSYLGQMSKTCTNERAPAR